MPSVPADSLTKGELLMEYTGELIRRPIADVRERSGSTDIYFFTVDDDLVIDGARCGGIARFINHSCRYIPASKKQQ